MHSDNDVDGGQESAVDASGDATSDVERAIVHAADRAEGAGADAEDPDKVHGVLRYWYEERAAYYLGGYLRALRGDELEAPILRNCMEGVEAPDELDPEALDEAIDEIDEIRRRLEAKHEGAFEMATTETGVDLFGWEEEKEE